MRLCSIGETELILTPEALLGAVVLLLFAPLRTVSLAGTTLLLHETAHMLAAKRVGVTVTELKLLPFGASMRTEQTDVPLQEATVVCAGPLANFAAAGTCALWMLFSTRAHPVSEPLLLFNLAMGLWNLLPVFPLDGGRLLRALLRRRLSERRVQKITVGSSVCVCALLLGTFAWLAMLGRVGWAALLFPGGAEMMSARGLLEQRAAGVQTILRHRSVLHRGGAMEILPLALKGTETLRNAAAEIRGGRYALLYVIGENGERIGTLGEEELLSAMGRFGADAALQSVLQK